MERVEGYLADQVAKRPDALALTDTTGAAWSYADLNAAVEAFADLFRNAGVAPTDRVLIIAENCGAAVAAVFAAFRVGAIAVPVNARQSAQEIDRIIGHAEPALIICTSAVSPDAATHAKRLSAEPQQSVFGVVDVVTRTSQPEPGDADVAVLLYTTGTTGNPKGVMLTHGNVRFGARTSANLRAMTNDDLIYGVLPMTHVFGLCSVMVASICAGASIRLVPRFDPAQLCLALRDGVTLFSGVPQMHAVLMAHVKAQGDARLGSPTLRYVSSGAAPLDPTWKREAEAFYGVALQNGYGMTETTAGIAATSSALGDPDTSVGPALPDIEIEIDETVPGGGDGMGEVVTRGPHVMKGYFRNPSATAEVLRNAWMHTGDLGRIDAAGRLHILGRSKELIIHGGFNVYPPEVEAALNDHPDVVQAAVVGRRMAGDEEVLAFCQVDPACALTPDALMEFVRARLAGYKRPSRIILAASLPAAPTGKILKHKLIDAFADRLETV